MHYKNLILAGSSHVSKESVDLVKKTIENENPGIIAVELDKDRLNALLNEKKRGFFIRGVGFKGWLFALIGAWVENRIGKIVNVKPGSEMKAAIELARKNNAKLALIDQNIAITLKRFSKTISWKEKFRFLYDITIGIIFPSKELRRLNMKNMSFTKVPDKETINKVLEFAKKRYPNFYNVLVTERNTVMANNLAHIMKTFPDEKVFAVVGAGHEEGIMKILKRM